MNLKKIINILIFLIVNQSFSQVELPLGTYLSENEKEYIVIMANNSFGFISYVNESPYLYQKKYKKKNNNIDCGRGFLVDISGSGKYKIENDSIKLTFVESKSIIDSLKISYLSTEKNENPVNVTFIPHYNYIKIGITEVEVKDSNNQIIANVYDNNLSPNIGILRFPLELILNDYKKLILSEQKNQQIDLFINCFKTYNINININKTFNIKFLKKIIEE